MTLNERVNELVNYSSCLMTVKMVVSVGTEDFIGSRVCGNMCPKKLGLILQSVGNH